MRFALSTGSLYTYGLNRVFALAAEVGFDGLEVLVDRRFDTRQSDYLQRLVAEHQIPILSLHAPFRPARMSSWPNDNPNSVQATAALARELGAEIVVTHLPFKGDRPYARWLREELAAYQRAHPSPRIVVENMPLRWLRWWPFFPVEGWEMNRLDEWSRFPYLILDTTHLATKGQDPIAVYRRLRDQVAHIHISNARRQGKRIWEHRRLEDGFLALDDFLAHLARAGYDGIVTVELHPNALRAKHEKKVRRHLQDQLDFCRKHTALPEE